jgi:hypothetical protein
MSNSFRGAEAGELAQASACATKGPPYLCFEDYKTPRRSKACWCEKRSSESRVNNVDEGVTIEDPFAPDRIKVGEGFGGDGFIE